MFQNLNYFKFLTGGVVAEIIEKLTKGRIDIKNPFNLSDSKHYVNDEHQHLLKTPHTMLIHQYEIYGSIL